MHLQGTCHEGGALLRQGISLCLQLILYEFWDGLRDVVARIRRFSCLLTHCLLKAHQVCCRIFQGG